jgi:hypothetical protein
MKQGDKQLDILKSYFPQDNKKSNNTEIITNKKLNYNNVFTFIGANTDTNSSVFTLNLFTMDTKLNNSKNIVINIDSSNRLDKYFRGIKDEKVFHTEVEDLFIYKNIVTSKKELIRTIQAINRLDYYDNIIIINNFENDFIDTFAYSNFNILITNLSDTSVLKLDKILKVLSEYRNINFGIFLIDLDIPNIKKKTLQFASNDLMQYHKNLFLIGITYFEKVLEVSGFRKTLPFKNFELINQSKIFYDYKRIVENFNLFIKDRKQWLNTQKIKKIA